MKPSGMSDLGMFTLASNPKLYNPLPHKTLMAVETVYMMRKQGDRL